MLRVFEEPRRDGVEFIAEGPAGRKSLKYWWDGDATPSDGSKLATAAVGLLPLAMTSGHDLELQGPVDPSLLISLQEWADAWAFIRADLFSPVTIRSTESVDWVPRSDRRSGVVAFSGGIDSLHAATEHITRVGEADPVLALVHGFDIGLEDERAFNTARLGAAGAAALLGRPLACVRTNWRADFSQHWTMEFAAGLTSVLHLWRDDAATAVLGSDEGSGYSFEVYPWSSNPATNHLLGSQGFPITTHGFSSDRVDKCRIVASHPELLEAVRVCLHDDAGGRNCGRCEKCIRTKLCFAAAGVRDVAAFPEDDTGLSALRLHKAHLLDYFEAVLRHQPNELSRDEVDATRSFLNRERRRLVPSVPRRAWRSARYRVRRFLRS